MRGKPPLLLLITLLGVGPMSSRAADGEDAALDLARDSSIVFIGNTFAERMALFGYFETVLHSRFPDHRLKIRNLGWSADEVALRPRPKGFGDMHRYLNELRVDWIFACFGMNESFEGAAGLRAFRRNVDALVKDLLARRYNGRTPPRIVLISPIAHEDLGGDLPNGKEQNQNLELYTRAMAEAARRHGLRFVDLFTPTLALAKSSPEKKLTFNGIHLTASGDWTVSQIMARSLGLVTTIVSPADTGKPGAEPLRRAVHDKNYTFFFHWRGPNMEYVHGERNRIPGAERLPEERAQLQSIIAQLDQKIWEMPKPAPEEVWDQAPGGRPLWSTTPRYEGIRVPEITTVKRIGKHRDEEEGVGNVLDPARAREALRLPKGYGINVYASEETTPIANPVALNFDARGRLWIGCSPTWPHPIPGKPPTDSIVILEDSDRDGVADGHTVFLGGLNMIHGFALGHGGAYISQTPNIIHARDTDGDDRADQFRTVLHGFGGEDVEHSINNYKWGPDGALYFMEGIFFHSQVETPYGPRRLVNAGVFRYAPRTERFDVFVSNAFWNPWGQVFDRWGQSIILDASSHDYYNMDVLSANFVYPKKKRNLARRLSFTPGDFSPGAGLEIIRSRHFPEEAQGRFLANEVAGPFRGTRWYDITEDGTSYKLERLDPELVVSRDPYFRPIAVTCGPDGALYFADFYSTLFENMMHPKRATGRDHTRGRIWRVSCEGRPLLTPPRIVGEPIPVLLDLLLAYENTTRHFARRELQERDAADVIPHLKRWVAGLDPDESSHELSLLEALWIYQGLEIVEPTLLRRVLGARDHRVRASATRVLRFWQDRIDGAVDLLDVLVEDENPRVRLQAVLACGFSPSDRALGIALKATKRLMDAGLEHALDDTVDYLLDADSAPAAARRRTLELPDFPEGAAYVLGRLSNDELVNMERTEPVSLAMVTRDGLDASFRKEAIAALARIRGTDELSQVLDGIARLEKISAGQDGALSDLVQLLMATPSGEMRKRRAVLVELATSSTENLSREAGYASLLIADDGAKEVWRLAESSPTRLVDLLASIPMIPDPNVRATLYSRVEPLLHDVSNRAVRGAAILAIASLPRGEERTFLTLSSFVRTGTERDAAIEALGKLPIARWPKSEIPRLAESVVKYVTGVPPPKRNTREFKRALRLASDLAPFLPPAEGKTMRDVLGTLGIRTATVRVIPHVLLFDRTHLVIEAGKPIEITFENPGIMPHNLVIVAPGAMEEVGLAADHMIADPGDGDGKRFVPESDKVLFATPMVGPGKSATLAFVAPKAVGEYPYLCTYPGHWVRMNGVLHVVEDVDRWIAENPDKASGGSTAARAFVRVWRPEDLVGKLGGLALGRSLDRGKELFTAASCVACHQVHEAGGVIGPDLTEASTRLKPAEMLEEMIKPSKTINEKFRSWVIVLDDGQVVTGMIKKEDTEAVHVVANPLVSGEGTEIRRARITAMEPSKVSTMPMGLLNTLTEEEILDLLAYVRSGR